MGPDTEARPTLFTRDWNDNSSAFMTSLFLDELADLKTFC